MRRRPSRRWSRASGRLRSAGRKWRCPRSRARRSLLALDQNSTLPIMASCVTSPLNLGAVKIPARGSDPASAMLRPDRWRTANLTKYDAILSSLGAESRAQRWHMDEIPQGHFRAALDHSGGISRAALIRPRSKPMMVRSRPCRRIARLCRSLSPAPARRRTRRQTTRRRARRRTCR